MSRVTDAHDRLVSAQFRASGLPCEATIGTQTVAAVIGALEIREVFVPGGVAEAAVITVQITKSLLTDFAEEPNGWPPQYTPTIVRGIAGKVLHPVRECDGVFYIMTGDPAAQE